MANEWDIDDRTIVDGPFVAREIADDDTTRHVTEPDLILATHPGAELPTNDQWVAGFQRGATVGAADERHIMRLAILEEALATGANRGWSETFANAVLERAAKIRRREEERRGAP